jgi:uncharacterized protein YfkK (UPF0435 family)
VSDLVWDSMAEEISEHLDTIEEIIDNSSFDLEENEQLQEISDLLAHLKILIHKE